MEFDHLRAAAGSSARWPGRLRELALLWRRPIDSASRDALAAEMWKLLNVVLHRYVRHQARRLGGCDTADVVDVAADKALELFDGLEQGRWDPVSGTEAQTCAFLASVARNGIVDLLRRRGREAHAITCATWAAEAPRDLSRDDVESTVDGSRYAQAIVACAASLTDRSRLAWFLRTFCDIPVAHIARHPEVRTSIGGVHLMLNRSRRHLRKCMQSRGFDPTRMPPGTFVALWDLIETERRARAGRGIWETGT